MTAETPDIAKGTDMAIAPANEIVPAAASNAAAAVVLFDQDKFDAFYAKLQADIDAVPVDLTTKKGRDAIASAAAKVRTEKASIDRDRKRLTQEWRDNTALVNGAWKGIEARLDDLAVSARKPLTDWEEAEKSRIAAIEGMIAQLKAHARVDSLDTAAMVRERGTQVWCITLDPDVYQERLAEVEQIKAEAVDALKNALARLTKEEADRAELERLRAAEAEREAADAAKREEEERAEGKRRHARDVIAHIEQCGLGMIGGKTYPYVILMRELEEKIEMGEAAKQAYGDMAQDVERVRFSTLERLKEAAKAQAERAEREAAEEARRQALEESEREKQAEIDKANRRAEEAERAAQAERDRIAKEEADRQAEANRIAAEQARREADQAHRTSVKTAAKQALMTCGADEETARKIVVAILAGEVPNVTLRF
ncbi:hypothetical protein HH800_05850 [Sphingobium yanoikuyae]|uniref:DUF1351 domain-containing protein n=2 Tax=Sphingobium yanoikuyae TaxID=13690 RepID=A0A6M4G4C5_SPHYA|nr:hypothetical protein HH800_05850 [Sphingobium yanoikuyae]